MSENKNGELKKNIDAFGAASILFNIIIGSGIFYLGSLVLMYAGFSQGLAMAAWILGGIVSMLAGLHYAELGTSIKKSGGQPVYLNEAYHPIVGYIMNISQIFVSSPAATASFALAFVGVFGPSLGLGDTGTKIAGIAFIATIFVLNLLGNKIALAINKVSLVLKLTPLAIIIIAGFLAGKVQPDMSFVSEMSGGGVATFSLLLLGTNATLWAYSGYQLIPAVSTELENPEKDIPKVLVVGVGAITIIYLLFNFAIFKVIPYNTLVANISGGDFYQGTAAAKELFSFGGYLVNFCILVSVFGSALSSMMTAARTQRVIADSGRFPKVWGHITEKGVPMPPMIGQLVGGIIFVLASSLQGLTILTTFTSSVFDLLCIIAVPVLRKRQPTLERPFKVPADKILTPITILIFAAIVANTVATNLDKVAIGLVMPVVAVIIWFVYGKINEKK